MNGRLVYMLLLLAAPLSLPAQNVCPNPEKLRNLCGKIGTKQEDPDPNSAYLYTYQRIVHEAACADPKVESEDVVRKKIQELWNTKHEYLFCDNSQFNVIKGNVVKYAAYNLLTDFIVDVAEVWKVDLNWVDKADDRTVLDYIDKELKLKKGTSVGDAMETYHNTLRKAGAKHSQELEESAP